MPDASKSVAKNLPTLDCVAKSPTALSAREIFDNCSLARSSGYDLLNELTKSGFLARRSSRRWVLGNEIRDLALASQGLGHLASRVHPLLRALQNDTQGTVQLAVLYRDHVLTTHCYSSVRGTRMRDCKAVKVPIIRTAAGHVLAGSLGDGRISHISSSRSSPRWLRCRHGAETRRTGRDCRTGLGGDCIAAVSLILPAARLLARGDIFVSLVCSAAATPLSLVSEDEQRPERWHFGHPVVKDLAHERLLAVDPA